MEEVRVVAIIIDQFNECPVIKHSCFQLELIINGISSIITDQEFVNRYTRNWMDLLSPLVIYDLPNLRVLWIRLKQLVKRKRPDILKGMY